MSNKIHFTSVSEDYTIKFDGYRDNHRWTALGPEGRIGDFETADQAYRVILAIIESGE